MRNGVTRAVCTDFCVGAPCRLHRRSALMPSFVNEMRGRVSAMQCTDVCKCTRMSAAFGEISKSGCGALAQFCQVHLVVLWLPYGRPQTRLTLYGNPSSGEILPEARLIPESRFLKTINTGGVRHVTLAVVAVSPQFCTERKKNKKTDIREKCGGRNDWLCRGCDGKIGVEIVYCVCVRVCGQISEY